MDLQGLDTGCQIDLDATHSPKGIILATVIAAKCSEPINNSKPISDNDLRFGMASNNFARAQSGSEGTEVSLRFCKEGFPDSACTKSAIPEPEFWNLISNSTMWRV